MRSREGVRERVGKGGGGCGAVGGDELSDLFLLTLSKTMPIGGRTRAHPLVIPPSTLACPLFLSAGEYPSRRLSHSHSHGGVVFEEV